MVEKLQFYSGNGLIEKSGGKGVSIFLKGVSIWFTIKHDGETTAFAATWNGKSLWSDKMDATTFAGDMKV